MFSYKHFAVQNGKCKAKLMGEQNVERVLQHFIDGFGLFVELNARLKLVFDYVV